MRTLVVILALMAFAAAGGWIAKSNYEGVCFWTGKRLSDRKKMELAFKETSLETWLRASGKFPVKPGTDERKYPKLGASDEENIKYYYNSQEWHEEVGYRSLDEYVALYPDCCKLKWLGNEKDPDWPEPTFWQRVSGDYGFGVEIKALLRYKRPDGSSYTKQLVFHPYFTNCGERSPHFYHGG